MARTEELRFRQIHLDFHTHQDIEAIGADFDPKTFADTLAAARVDSINMFARGHHGYVYYRSKRFADRVHPHLKTNLLKQQIQACHKRNIKAPIYITVQWDALTAEEHPEWLVRDPSGKQEGVGLYDAGFYNRLCLNSPYVDWLQDFTLDVMQNLPVDGFWFDIVGACDCSCTYCRRDMIAQGLDPADNEARRRFGVEVLYAFKRRMTRFVRKHDKKCLLFYNAGHVGPRHRPVVDAYTHLELESLPSGGWGYMHFPLTARYARTLGKDFLGMTGKFHTTWGDFHSFKNQEALAFECYTMLALNAKCSIGDQLPPRGRICPHTYKLIGSVYKEVETREPWCRRAQPVTEIAVITPEAFMANANHGNLAPSALGACRMLQEGQYQFDFVDPEQDLSAYSLVILPDEIPVDAALARKLEAFVKQGGALLASHRSGLTPEGDRFALKCLGLSLQGDAEYQPTFIVPRGAVGKGLPATEHVMYERALAVKPQRGSKVLCQVRQPYFNRTWEHYCSHQHAPSNGKTIFPGVVQRGRVMYFAHPIFTQYSTVSPRWCKVLLHNALDMLLGERLLRTSGPTTLTSAINEQKSEKRLCLHLLHCVPVLRGKGFEVVEDVYPLHDLEISMRVERRIKAVRCVPEMTDLDFAQKDGRVEFVVPKLDGYQIVSVEY